MNICTQRKKSNSHCAPQPYINRSVFKSFLNCTSEISLSRNARGREYRSRRRRLKTRGSLLTHDRSRNIGGALQQISMVLVDEQVDPVNAK